MNTSKIRSWNFNLFVVLLQYYIVFLLIQATCIWAFCGILKPNKNVAILCYNNNGPTANNREYIKCDATRIKINTNTKAIYQCEKYYKPIAQRLNGGRLNCTAKGWTNLASFMEFRCELDCGKQPALRSSLVQAGEETSPKRWPWVATIYKKNNKGNILYTCGGTLIGIKTVLTAAHCVVGKAGNLLPASLFRVALASVSSEFEENLRKGASMHEIREIIIHPSFNNTFLDHDLALLELSNPVTLSDTVLPICLPISFEHDALVLSPEKVGEIASFGTDGTGTGLPAKKLQYAEIRILTSLNCYSEIDVIPKSEQYCGGNVNNNGPNLCKGDSGSGMVFKYQEFLGSKYVIHGLVSNTGELYDGCAPVVIFPKIYRYIKWILDILVNLENPTGVTEIVPSAKPTVDSSVTDFALESYTDNEKAALAKLRQLIRNLTLEDYMYRDDYLIRFLRAKDFKLQETRDMLEANMVWRKENRVNEIVNEDFSKFQKDYPVFFQGKDKDGRPLAIHLVGLWDMRKIIANGESNQFLRYYIRNSEELATRARNSPSNNISQFVSILDGHGLNLRQHLCGPCVVFLIRLVRIYENYYPNLAYITFFINVPEVLTRSLSPAVRLLISQHTFNSLRIYGTNKGIWSKALLQQIPRNQLYRAYGGTRTIKNGSKGHMILSL